MPWVPKLKGFIPAGKYPRNNDLIWVKDLIDDTCWRWNRALIEESFEVEEATAILAISGLNPHEKDKLTWAWNNAGKHTVASTYSALIERKWRIMDVAGSSVHQVEQKRIRRRTWNLKLQGKVKHFIWKGTQNILPVLVNLKGRVLNLDQICKFCGEEEESQEHMFFHCPRAVRIWKMSPVSWDGLKAHTHTFRTWWSALCTIPSKPGLDDRIHFSCYLLWWIWKTRNLWVFKQALRSERDTVKLALENWQLFSANL
ncbi:Unknown protein [Striga hermonthica]|uniref:Reverse transcriptase zinc-binding domain-containing protein n=1 Tax=Striga hermonthica TaxID=68872 RepID=A0A9N7NWZ0_STRHE|nr:Unknown protein [Striga hermonthica]